MHVAAVVDVVVVVIAICLFIRDDVILRGGIQQNVSIRHKLCSLIQSLLLIRANKRTHNSLYVCVFVCVCRYRSMFFFCHSDRKSHARKVFMFCGHICHKSNSIFVLAVFFSIFLHPPSTFFQYIHFSLTDFYVSALARPCGFICAMCVALSFLVLLDVVCLFVCMFVVIVIVIVLIPLSFEAS